MSRGDGGELPGRRVARTLLKKGGGFLVETPAFPLLVLESLDVNPPDASPLTLNSTESPRGCHAKVLLLSV